MEYKVYVKVDENGYIYDVNSSAFLSDVTGWTEIDRGYGDKYHHAQNHYFEKPIITINGAYQYRKEGSKVNECSSEEIAEQENTPVIKQPSEIEDLSALVIDQEYRITLLELGLVE